MCGFSGVLFSNKQVRDNYPAGLEGFRRSAARISHRGDTDHREHLQDTFWLSHYRLAFQDIQSGSQPMISQDGQHIIVFNGELYNHLELRKVIQQTSNFQFKTRSDTETILEGWKILGDNFFEMFDGEYAFLIIHRESNQFIAHRDLYGVKPMYFRLDGIDSRIFSHLQSDYTFTTPKIEFSSEVKGLASKKPWCRDGLLRQYVGLFEPICTPFKEIIHLPPGAILHGKQHDKVFNCRLVNRFQPARRPTEKIVAPEKSFETELQKAVADRTLSDVELGIYLSGGVDSKSIAYELARAKPQENIKSFTVGFQQSGYDETQEALRFANHMGFSPHVLRIDDEALNYSYPLAVQTSELVQPFTNGAAKWWLSLFAREYVHGVLTGDGADEVFCGYPSYRYVNWWKFIMRGRGKAKTPQDVLNLISKYPLGSSRRDFLYRSRFAADQENPWLSGSSAEGDGSDFVNSIREIGVPHPLFGQIQTITRALLGKEAGDSWLRSQASSIQSIFAFGLPELLPELCNPQHALLLWQNYFTKSHLPVLIVNWVGDRMEMSNTLEGRTPFLSRRVYNFMKNQPDHALVHGLRDKVLLRRTYARLFPASFAKVPKKQFNAPFLNSEKLMQQFNTASIYEDTGITSNDALRSLQQQIKTSANDSYQAAHLNSTLQTAMCLSIVNHTIVNDESISRDVALQERYLSHGGPVK